ncbi:MAG TPA: hypothetical protein VMB72_08350 [Acidimicrobiales bacterium]|nr:hypothetical protein [Acidimicrobiales bacterium]
MALAAPGPSDATALLSGWCPGSVTVHLDLAVSCSSDTCQHDLPRAYWFSLHGTFARCSEARGAPGPCPECGFAPS